MVIGSDVEEQLAPYNENIKVPEYCRGEVTEKDKNNMVKYYRENENKEYSSFDECYAENGEDWNGNTWRKDENGIWSEYSTYNPKSKWDWYSIGGRWSGEFITHVKDSVELQDENYGEGSWCHKNVGIDSIEKKYIDFDAIRKEAEDEARGYYRGIASLFKGGIIPKVNMTWKQICDMFPEKSRDELNEIYSAQDGVQEWDRAVKEDRQRGDDRKIGFFTTVDDFQMSEDEYVKQAGDNSFVPYALVKDGKWYERGTMGWWGVSMNEQDPEEWRKFVQKILNETSDDTLITIVDCHI